MLTPMPLDEWYRKINSIYLDRNFHKSPESVLSHLTEVVGGLSVVASGKKKPGVEPEAFLAKAIGWWMALCGKVGVRSINNMIWTKFPYACPYCQLSPHVQKTCKQRREMNRSPQWQELAEIGQQNRDKRPVTLWDWQDMFDKIYPRSDLTSHEKNFSRLSEEIGELSEALRVLPITRAYFLSEAADVFAWLMGQANQFAQGKSSAEMESFLEELLFSEYPGKCRHCGGEVCKCPPILLSTLGRIAHEMPLSNRSEPESALFTFQDALEFFRQSESSIAVAGKKLSVTPDLFEELRNTTNSLLNEMKKQNTLSLGVHTNMVIAIAKIQDLASQQQITQKSVDELVEAFRNLPSESRQVVVGFLNNVIAGSFLHNILTLAGVA